jgi:hypothetical protein
MTLSLLTIAWRLGPTSPAVFNRVASARPCCARRSCLCTAVDAARGSRYVRDALSERTEEEPARIADKK